MRNISIRYTLSNVSLFFCGCAFYSWCLIKNRNAYKGANEFFRTIQLEHATFSKKAGIAFLESYNLSRLFIDYRLLKENINRERISSIALKQYSDDSLLGYGDIELNKDIAKEIENQQRGLILPLLERTITEEKKSRIIVEIGTGNGDVLAYLAVKYPQHTYIGIDFSIKNAQAKHSLQNLKFIKGYALDMLQNKSIQGDIVFTSSTAVVFTPKELKAYLIGYKKCGFSQIILNEPTWAGNVQLNNDKVMSKYMEYGSWYHNWCGYLREAGYDIKNFDYFHYKHTTSTRPDIFISLIKAERS